MQTKQMIQTAVALAILIAATSLWAEPAPTSKSDDSCGVMDFPVNAVTAKKQATALLPKWLKKIRFLRNVKLNDYDVKNPVICSVIQTDCGGKTHRMVLAYWKKHNSEHALAMLMHVNSENPLQLGIGRGGGGTTSSPPDVAATDAKHDICD